MLSGFGKLRVNDQNEIRQHIGKADCDSWVHVHILNRIIFFQLNAGENPVAKRSFEQMSGGIDESSSKTKKPKLSENAHEPAASRDFMQLRDIANLRDKIQKNIGTQMQQMILAENKQFVPNNNIDVSCSSSTTILCFRQSQAFF